MIRLNLPSFEFNIKEKDGKPSIFDILRRKFIIITPEEWVRQHFVHYLIKNKEFPQSLMANEMKITLNNTTKRCDTVVYNNELRPIVIVEYKAPHIKITKETFEQIARYNMVLQVPYLIVSNGIQHFICKVDYKNSQYIFLKDIPSYKDIMLHLQPY